MKDSGAVEQALAELTGCYPAEDFPALSAQLAEWRVTRPLAGMKILDSTPVFRNTLLKYRNLVAAGAELTAAVGALDPYDPEITRVLPQIGVPVVFAPPETPFDAVLDCAGCHTRVPSRLGYVELTRSGVLAYGKRAAEVPVFAADSGRIKLIETALGTGESFLRAYEKLFPGEAEKQKFMLFGFGKVGRGIAAYLRRAGAQLVVADLPDVLARVPQEMEAVSIRDRERINGAWKQCDVIITATGVKDALAEVIDMEELISSDIRIAAMGVEDEFGPAMPEERVLNRKQPLNFTLAEPTLLSYIETTMALHNEGVLELARRGGKPGMFAPPAELEERLLAPVLAGRHGREIGAMLTELEA